MKVKIQIKKNQIQILRKTLSNFPDHNARISEREDLPNQLMHVWIYVNSNYPEILFLLGRHFENFLILEDYFIQKKVEVF